MEWIADKIITLLQLDKEDSQQVELYRYGICEGLHILVNVVTMAIVGLLFHKMWECIIFYLSYMFLRVYAGGYHADTRIRCYLLSSGMLAVFLLTVEIVKDQSFLFMILTGVAAMIIIWLAPVENDNHPLDEKEQKYFRYIAIGVLIVYLLLIMVGLIAKWKLVTACLTETVIWVAVMLIMGRWKYGSKSE